MGVEAVEEKLLSALSDSFNLPTQKFVIQDPDSLSLLHELVHVANGLMFKKEDLGLMIVIYHGYATRADGKDMLKLLYVDCPPLRILYLPRPTVLFSGSSAPNPPTQGWDIMEEVLSLLNGDSLATLNCCAPTTAETKNSEVEYLVASEPSSSTEDNISISFASRLANVIRSFAGSRVTVAQLHARLVAGAGSDKLSNYTPVRIAPTTKPSVALEPFLTNRNLAKPQKVDTVSDRKILIRANLQEQNITPLDVEQWAQRLAREIPEDIASINIEAVSGSSDVLLTVPIEVWDMMEDNDAYSFVDFVTGD